LKFDTSDFQRKSRLRGRALVKICTYVLVIAALAFSGAAYASEPTWPEIHAKHFSVLTDAGDKRGREIALRLEQMRAIFGSLLMKSHLNMPVPLTVLALKNGQQYAEMAPLKMAKANASGFLLQGDDHIYIVLDASAEEPWHAVASDYASLLLNFNYPQTQPWFDEGFTQYFSSVWLTDRQMELGGDPAANSRRPFTEVLRTEAWLPITELFTIRVGESGKAPASQREMCSAESWIIMHYMLNKDKLSEAGTYFDLVLNQKMPVDQAILKAFGTSAPEFEQAVKNYFHSLISRAQTPAGQPGLRTPLVMPRQFPPMLGPDDIAMTLTQTPESEARAHMADVMARVPDHREQGIKQLEGLAGAPAGNEAAHRALAWQNIQGNEFNAAARELTAALELNRRDVWLRYYLSVLKYRIAENTGESIPGLANMMQDLRAVLDWYPEFAEAYNMLAMARVEGGGMNSALEAIRAAIQLSPRNEQYVYNLGIVYANWKRWDQARAIFERLQTSGNPRLAAAATGQLQELQTKQKYGISPQKPVSTANETKPSANRAASMGPERGTPESDNTEPEKKPEAQALTTGPIQFAKGKLVSVDCSHSPAAVLTILSGGKTLKLHTADYKSLTLVGADTFSCEWQNRQVSINYRPSAKTAGVLVSLEVR
jgi:tetratricopeptide (TPR) repeat protein